MRIFVIGAEGSGKSTAARFLGIAMGLPVTETGQEVTKELARFLMNATDAVQDVGQVDASIHDAKEHLRKTLHYMGDLMTGLNPTVLVDRCISPYQPGIVVGMRRLREVNGLFDRHITFCSGAIWVRIVRPGVVDRTFELNDSPCNFEVQNDGSLKTLKLRMERVAQKIKTGKRVVRTETVRPKLTIVPKHNLN